MTPEATHAGQPTVSIIMPAYKTAAYIAESLESIFAQTFQSFEVIVVNDGSPDTESLERALEPYQDRIRYYRRPHLGPSATRNFGIENAHGEFIALLDSDDLWEPRYLEVLVGMLKTNPELDIVYSNAVMFGLPSLNGKRYMDMYPWEGEPAFAPMVKRECCVFGLVTARREAMIRAGLYDTDLIRCEDYELWLRAVKTGSRIGYTREVLVRYRRHVTSLCGNLRATAEDNVRALEKMKRMFQLDPVEQTAVEETLLDLHSNLHTLDAREAFEKGDYGAAADSLQKAIQYRKTRKTEVILALLRWMPGLLRFVYQTRARLLGLAPARR